MQMPHIQSVQWPASCDRRCPNCLAEETAPSPGNLRDDYRRHWRSAKQQGFLSKYDRFMNDPKGNYKFRCNMLANGWTEETVREIDAIAEAHGQPVPKAGQGRTWHQRT
jgi:hypothetical protein